MKKNIIVIVVMLVLSISYFSGCVEENEFIKNLDTYDEDIDTYLENIYFHLWMYEIDYDWNSLMNYLTFTESMIQDMEEYESDIDEEMYNLDIYIADYQDSKDTSGITDTQRDVYNNIEDMIDDYNSNKSSVDVCLSNMETYREFINLTRIKLQKLEEYEGELTLMNFKVEEEEYEEAKNYVENLSRIIGELSEIENKREKLKIQTYSEEIKGVWNMWIDVWELYDEYLDLLIEKKYSSADKKYDEYSALYDDVYAIESSETLTQVNSEISKWYQDNIGTYSELFEKYYFN